VAGRRERRGANDDGQLSAEVSTALFAEKRDGGKGGLTVIHPQADFGIDLGQYVTLDAGYSAECGERRDGGGVSLRCGVERDEILRYAAAGHGVAH